jgi:hypothetical protein
MQEPVDEAKKNAGAVCSGVSVSKTKNLKNKSEGNC